MEIKNLPTICNLGVPPEMPIARFVDPVKLFDLLIHGHLMFPSIKSLMVIDPYECFRPIAPDSHEHEQLLTRYALSHWELAEQLFETDLFWRQTEKERRARYEKRVLVMAPGELREIVSYLRRDKAPRDGGGSCWQWR